MSAQKPWSRRGFLSARGLGATTGGLVAALVPQPPKRVRVSGKTFQHWCVSRRAMGCEFTVMVPPDQPKPMASAEAALDEIGELEDLLSVYRADSAISRVNQSAAESPVRVNYRLYELLKRAADLTEQTEGAFDAGAGALVRAWGFLRGPRRVPTDTERQEALARCGIRHVVLDDETASVRYLVSGLEVNFGSIGKGYGIDQALKRMVTDFGTDCVLIQGGRSSIRAIGSPAGDNRGWVIGLQDPFNPDHQLGSVCLKDRGLATSSIVNQHFEADGRRYGHLIDPRTGWPADHLASATVLAPDATIADALSTALFVMGLDKAADFCHNHREIAALLVRRQDQEAGQDTLPRVVTFNLPPEDVELTSGDDPPGL